MAETHTRAHNTTEDGRHADDVRLAVACIARDEQAWAELLPRCRRFCRIIGHQYHLPADAFDEAFSDFILRLLGKTAGSAGALARYTGAVALDTYLSVVFRHVLFDYFNAHAHAAQRVETGIPLEQRADTTQGSPPGAIDQAEQDRLLEQALAALPVADRRLVVLHFFKGLTVQTIGDMFHCNKSTVSRQLARICGELKAKLERG